MRTLLLLLLLLWLPLSALAEDPVVITPNGRAETVEGKGRSFTIGGAGGSVTITGKANLVTVGGAGIKVFLDEPARIEVGGMDNEVRYKSGSPAISKGGLNNRIVIGNSSASTPAPAPGPGLSDLQVNGNVVKIEGAGGERTLAGEGRSFEVHGSAQRITITGRVSSLVVHGAGNQIEVEEPAFIEVHGANNVVVFAKGEPRIERHGVNEVRHK